MNDQQYLQHARERFKAFADTFMARTGSLPAEDPLRELAQGFAVVARGEADLYGEGQSLVSRLFTTYPDFSPTFPRELLWFLGGDCLHYMPDEEIAVYQQWEEQRQAAAERGEVINFAEARARLLQLN